MAINKKLIHFDSYANFNAKKLSANKTNTSYTIGIEGTVTACQGTETPDILWHSIVWIKDTRLIWTHGALYDCSNEVNFGIGDGLKLKDATTNEEVDLIEILLADTSIGLKDTGEGKGLYTDASLIPVRILGTQEITITEADCRDIDTTLHYYWVKELLIPKNSSVKLTWDLALEVSVTTHNNIDPIEYMLFSNSGNWGASQSGLLGINPGTIFSNPGPYPMGICIVIESSSLQDTNFKINYTGPVSSTVQEVLEAIHVPAAGNGLLDNDHVFSVKPADTSINVTSAGIKTHASIIPIDLTVVWKRELHDSDCYSINTNAEGNTEHHVCLNIPKNTDVLVTKDGRARIVNMKYWMPDTAPVNTPTFSDPDTENYAFLTSISDDLSVNTGAYEAKQLRLLITTFGTISLDGIEITCTTYITNNVLDAIESINVPQAGDGLVNKFDVFSIKSKDESIYVEQDGISTEAAIIPATASIQLKKKESNTRSSLDPVLLVPSFNVHPEERYTVSVTFTPMEKHSEIVGDTGHTPVPIMYALCSQLLDPDFEVAVTGQEVTLTKIFNGEYLLAGIYIAQQATSAHLYETLEDEVQWSDLKFSPKIYNIEGKVKGVLKGRFMIQDLLGGDSGEGSGAIAIGEGLKNAPDGTLMTDIDAIARLQPLIESLVVTGDFNLACYSEEIYTQGGITYHQAVLKTRTANIGYILPTIIHVQNGSTVTERVSGIEYRKLNGPTLRKGDLLTPIVPNNGVFNEDAYIVIIGEDISADVDVTFTNIYGKTLAEMQFSLTGSSTDEGNYVKAALRPIEKARELSGQFMDTIFFCTDANYIFFAGRAYGTGDRTTEGSGEIVVFEVKYADRKNQTANAFNGFNAFGNNLNLSQIGSLIATGARTQTLGNAIIPSVADYFPPSFDNATGNSYFIDVNGKFFTPYKFVDIANNTVFDPLATTLATGSSNKYGAQGNLSGITKLNMVALRDYVKDFCSTGSHTEIIHDGTFNNNEHTYKPYAVDLYNGPVASTKASEYSGAIIKRWELNEFIIQLHLDDEIKNWLSTNASKLLDKRMNIVSFGTDSQLNTSGHTVHIIYPYGNLWYTRLEYYKNGTQTKVQNINIDLRTDDLVVTFKSSKTMQCANISYGSSSSSSVSNTFLSDADNLSDFVSLANSLGLYVGSLYGTSRLIIPVDMTILTKAISD